MSAGGTSESTDTHSKLDIQTEHLNNEKKPYLIKLCKQFKQLFYNEDNQLTFSNVVKHSFPMVDDIPIHTKSYRYPFIHKEETQKKIFKNASAEYY